MINMIRSAFLALGVFTAAHVVSTPGDQIWLSLLAGALLGTYSATASMVRGSRK
jgi:hypothetical protein